MINLLWEDLWHVQCGNSAKHKSTYFMCVEAKLCLTHSIDSKESNINVQNASPGQPVWVSWIRSSKKWHNLNPDADQFCLRNWHQIDRSPLSLVLSISSSKGGKSNQQLVSPRLWNIEFSGWHTMRGEHCVQYKRMWQYHYFWHLFVSISKISFTWTVFKIHQCCFSKRGALPLWYLWFERFWWYGLTTIIVTVMYLFVIIKGKRREKSHWLQQKNIGGKGGNIGNKARNFQ